MLNGQAVIIKRSRARRHPQKDDRLCLSTVLSHARLSVYDNVAPPSFLHRGRARQLDHILSLIESVRAQARADISPGSSAEARCRGWHIARALVNKTRFILADEPQVSRYGKQRQDNGPLKTLHRDRFDGGHGYAQYILAATGRQELAFLKTHNQGLTRYHARGGYVLKDLFDPGQSLPLYISGWLKYQNVQASSEQPEISSPLKKMCCQNNDVSYEAKSPDRLFAHSLQSLARTAACSSASPPCHKQVRGLPFPERCRPLFLHIFLPFSSARIFTGTTRSLSPFPIILTKTSIKMNIAKFYFYQFADT